MDIFEHVKSARWQHCTADNFKTLEASCKLVRLLCALRWLNMCIKFHI